MRVAGSTGQQVAKRNIWTQSHGDAVEYTYKGTTGFAEGVFALARGNCAEAELDILGAIGVVRARYASITDNGSGEEQIRVEIRMGRNDVQKSIFEPGVDGYVISPEVNDEELRYIQRAINDPSDEVSIGWLDAFGSPDGNELYRLGLQGVQYRIVSQPTLIQITTASSLFQWPNMSALANRILSNATLLGLLRQAPNFTIAASGSGPTGFNYGWRMSDPVYDASSDGHTSEMLEFEYGLWPSLLFGSLA